MDSQPIRDERILEALEVCRPGSEEPSDPVLAELADQLSANPDLKRLYDQIQEADRKVSAAFHEVPVPEGLAQRILERLESQRAAAVDAVSRAEPRSASAEAPGGPTGVSRRRWMAAAAALSAAAVLLVSAVIYLSSGKTYDEAAVLEDAVKFFGEGSTEQGHLLAERRPPEAYPLSRDVQRLPGTRWREIKGFLGRSGVAYDLPMPGRNTRATLYVVKMKVGGLKSAAPPARPSWDTAGFCTAAWQSERLLYVLVVQGDRQTYKDCLAPLGPVT